MRWALSAGNNRPTLFVLCKIWLPQEANWKAWSPSAMQLHTSFLYYSKNYSTYVRIQFTKTKTFTKTWINIRPKHIHANKLDKIQECVMSVRHLLALLCKHWAGHVIFSLSTSSYFPFNKLGFKRMAGAWPVTFYAHPYQARKSHKMIEMLKTLRHNGRLFSAAMDMNFFLFFYLKSLCFYYTMDMIIGNEWTHMYLKPE